MAPKGVEGSAVAAEHQLTEDQIAEFKEVGVLGPLPLLHLLRSAGW